MASRFYANYADVAALVYNPLLLPGHKPVFTPETLSANISGTIGTVLGKVTATGLLLPCVKTATDGSQVPYAVIGEPFDTTVNGPAGVAAVGPASVMVNAYVNYTALSIDPSWGATIDAAWAAIEPALRTAGIFGRAPGYSS